VDILIIAQMFPTFDERVHYLEELGLHDHVDTLLQDGNQWERQGLVYEQRLQLGKAAEVWKRLGHTKKLERLEHAASRLDDWLTNIAEPGPATFKEAYESLAVSGTTTGKVGQDHLYYVLQDVLHRYQKLSQLLPDIADLRIEQVRALLRLNSSWQANIGTFKQCHQELASETWPERCSAEELGAYRTHYDEGVFLVANCQRKKWSDRELLGKVHYGAKKVAVMSSVLARSLGKVFEKAISEIQLANHDLLLRLRMWSHHQLLTRRNFRLKLPIEVG
jgi:hypothetical protein